MHAVVALQVRLADGAANRQRAVGRSAGDLAGLAAHGVDARVERAVAATGGVQCDGTGNHGGFKQALGGQQRVDGQTGRHLRAVDQRQAFFGRQAYRVELGLRQRLCGGHTLAFKKHFAFANQRQAQVR